MHTAIFVAFLIYTKQKNRQAKTWSVKNRKKKKTENERK